MENVRLDVENRSGNVEEGKYEKNVEEGNFKKKKTTLNLLGKFGKCGTLD